MSTRDPLNTMIVIVEIVDMNDVVNPPNIRAQRAETRIRAAKLTRLQSDCVYNVINNPKHCNVYVYIKTERC